MRLSDDRVVNKHYDLVGVADLDTLIEEVVNSIRDGATPPGAHVP